MPRACALKWPVSPAGGSNGTWLESGQVVPLAVSAPKTICKPGPDFRPISWHPSRRWRKGEGTEQHLRPLGFYPVP